MNIIRPGIFDVGIFFCRELSFFVHALFTYWNQGMKTLFYVNWEELEKNSKSSRQSGTTHY